MKAHPKQNNIPLVWFYCYIGVIGSISRPKKSFKKVGLHIKRAPRKEKQHNPNCLTVTFSPNKILANISTKIGEVTISEKASPSGSSTTPEYHKILHAKPRNPLK